MADVSYYQDQGRGKQQLHWGDRDREPRYSQHYQQQQRWNESRGNQVVKAATSVTVGGSLLVLSGLTLAGTIIALVTITPLLVIFSPVLVPAAITLFMIVTGFFASGGFGVAAVTVLAWLYRYMTSEQQQSSWGDSWDRDTSKFGSKGRDMWDQETTKWGSKGRDFRDKSEHAVGGGHYATGGAHHAV